MKKVISILLVLFLIFTAVASYAATTEDPTTGSDTEEKTANIEFNLTGDTTIKEGTKTVTLTISLGAFTEVEEGQPLGFEGKLIYDKELFTGANVEGLNGWSASYDSSTNAIIGDVGAAKSNTQIAQITLTVADGVTSGTTGKVELQNILLTDDTNDFTFNKELTVSVEKTADEEQNITGTLNEVENTATANKTTNNNATDNTTAKTKKKKTGIKGIAIITVLVVLIVAIASLVRYKTIKLK